MLVQHLPDYALQFLLPSRYCQSDLLGDLATQFGPLTLTEMKVWVEAVSP